MSKNLIRLDSPQDTLELICNPIKLGEALTGILASDKNDLILSAGRLVQASLKWKLLTQLGRELNGYIEKGEIKEDYFATNNSQASFNELLSFIDQEVPDEERMRAMKSIFLSSISVNTSDEDERLAYELMQIGKKLSSGGILILKANFDIAKGNLRQGLTIDRKDSTADSWLSAIANQIGHKLPSLVEAHEQSLVNLALISKRVHQDLSGFKPTSHYRLTPSGYKLCELITRYP